MEALVLRHQDEVARLLWRFARNPTDLQDLVQETFLRMVRGLASWRADRPFLHWLRRITVNTGRDYCRRQTVRRRWMVDPTPQSEDDAPAPEPVDRGMNPAARTAANELKELLATLAPDDQAVLTLHHLEGWELKDIARQFSWSVTATKLRAWRARARLRALLEAKPLS